MARGVDTSREARRNLTGARAPGSSIHSAIRTEVDTQNYLFGTTVGTQDSGHRSLKMPAPVGGAYEGAPPAKIKLDTMRANREAAMPALMQPPPSNAPVSRLTLGDPGLGRLSDGVERPVHTYVDERIKKR